MRNAASFLKMVGQTTEIGGRMGVSDKNQIKRGKKGIYFKKGRGGGHLMKSNCIYNVIPKDISKGVPQKHPESLQEA